MQAIGCGGGMRYAVLAAVLLLAAPALAATWNEIEGTANADHIRGTDAPDRIRGLDGNDVLRARAGDDRLVGGPGDDVLNGGPGQDTYVCGGGEDVVVVDFARYAERIGDGCEAVIVDVEPHGPAGQPAPAPRAGCLTAHSPYVTSCSYASPSRTPSRRWLR